MYNHQLSNPDSHTKREEKKNPRLQIRIISFDSENGV